MSVKATKGPPKTSQATEALEQLDVDEVRVSETDSRHALINTRARE